MSLVPKILLADNDRAFTRQCAEFLQNAGYHVVAATTLEDARYHLQNTMLHLAVLDNRLIDNSDKEDFSGIRLAQASDQTIAKIIFTGFQNWEVVREALGLSGQGAPPACAFVAKKEGPSVLLEHVNRALEVLEISWTLEIVWETRDPLSIGHILHPDQNMDSLIQFSEAVTDVLHRLFRNYDRVNLVRVLWEERSRCAILVHASARNKPTGIFMLVLGSKQVVDREERRFRDYSPFIAQYGCPSLVSVKRNAYIGALAYSYANPDSIDTCRTLEQVLIASEKEIAASLRYFFKETLPSWNQGQLILDTKVSLREIVQQRTQVEKILLTRRQLRSTINSTAQYLSTLGIKIKFKAGSISLRLGIKNYEFPDPTQVLQSSTAVLTATCNLPGNLTPSRLFLDSEGRVYLTDFKDAGPLPAVWAPVMLESALRFDLMTVTTPQIMAIEELLNGADLLRPQRITLEPAVRRIVRAIFTIRHLSAESISADPTAYQLGIFFEAVRRLSETRTSAMTKTELLKTGHLIIALCFIGSTLCAKRVRNSVDLQQKRGVNIDSRHRTVTVDGARVHVTRRNYDLLIYLYNQAGTTCSREQLITNVFRENFDVLDHSQEDRLNMAISRLRSLIEIDSNQPQYLLSDPMGGYFLRRKL